MPSRTASIFSELKHHAPFTLFGALTGIVCMLLFKGVGNDTNYRLFQIFHPAHVFLSALVTVSLYKLRSGRTNLLLLALIGYFGSIGVATLSDCVVPYFGETILGVIVPGHSEVHHSRVHDHGDEEGGGHDNAGQADHVHGPDCDHDHGPVEPAVQEHVHTEACEHEHGEQHDSDVDHDHVALTEHVHGPNCAHGHDHDEAVEPDHDQATEHVHTEAFQHDHATEEKHTEAAAHVHGPDCNHDHEDAAEKSTVTAHHGHDCSEHGGIHFGFIEDWYLVNPAAILGILLAFWIPHEKLHTKIPHASHVLISTWASSFFVLMNTTIPMGLTFMVGMFIVLFIAVWLPCCISDIVFPILFVGPGRVPHCCPLHKSKPSEEN